MREEINLLKPEQQQQAGAGDKASLVLYLTIGFLVLEIAAWGGLWFYVRTVDNQISEQQMESARLDLEIKKNEKPLKDALVYQVRLGKFEGLLKQHVFWTPLFEELAKYTHKNITYETFDGDLTAGRFEVSGVASTYTDIGKLILGLKQSKNFSDIIFDSEGISTGEITGYGFKLDVRFNPSLLKK